MITKIKTIQTNIVNISFFKGWSLYCFDMKSLCNLKVFVLSGVNSRDTFLLVFPTTIVKELMITYTDVIKKLIFIVI